MKRKLALLIAAVMTVAMVPATAFASTKLTAVDEIKVGTDKEFTSRVELSKSNDQVDIEAFKEASESIYSTYEGWSDDLVEKCQKTLAEIRGE